MHTPVRVLVIEDNPVDAMVMCRYISLLEGWEPTRVESLGEAEDRVAEAGVDAFDAVLVDLTLPDAVGLEAVEFVSDFLPDAACIVSTAEDQFEVAEEAMTRGAIDYLVKGEMTPRGVQRALSYALNAKRLLRQAMEAEANLRRVLAASNDAIVVVNSKRSVLFANDAARPLRESLTRDDGSNRLDLEIRANEELDTKVRASDGRMISVIARARSINWAGHNALAVFVQDVSAQREVRLLQAQLQEAPGGLSLAMVDDWHTVKNLTRTIRDELDEVLRKEAELPGEVLPALGSARAASLHAIDTAMRYLRPPDAELRQQRVDVNALIRTCATFLASSIEAHATLRLRLGEVDHVVGDPWRLQAAVHNLLQNALDAVRSKGPGQHGIRVETAVVGKDVRISVLDTGCGIPEGLTLEDLTTKGSDKEEGAGVGLRGTVATVDAHEGRIWFESEAGTGTVFFVSLPSAPQVVATQGRPVLVLEDTPVVAEGIRRALGHLYDITVAVDGLEAMELLSARDDHHAVLCDLTMPRMDGRAFYEAVAECHPHLIERFVWSTGGETSDDMEAFVVSTERPRLYKPFHPDDAIEVIESVAPADRQR